MSKDIFKFFSSIAIFIFVSSLTKSLAACWGAWGPYCYNDATLLDMGYNSCAAYKSAEDRCYTYPDGSGAKGKAIYESGGLCCSHIYVCDTTCAGAGESEGDAPDDVKCYSFTPSASYVDMGDTVSFSCSYSGGKCVMREWPTGHVFYGSYTFDGTYSNGATYSTGDTLKFTATAQNSDGTIVHNCNDAFVTIGNPPTNFEGNIWIDSNGSGGAYPDDGEEFGPSTLSCNNQITHNGFTVSYGGTTNQQINNWRCHTRSDGSKISYYVSKSNIDGGSTFQATLSGLPSGYACDKWYWNHSLTAGIEAEGNGCTTASLTMPTSGWKNLNWKIKEVNVNPSGAIASASCSDTGEITTRGWACDANDYSTPLNVQINVDSPSYTATTVANLNLTDVTASCGSYSSRDFTHTTPPNFSPGLHNISVFAQDLSSSLWQSIGSTSVDCPAPPTYKLRVYLDENNGSCTDTHDLIISGTEKADLVGGGSIYGVRDGESILFENIPLNVHDLDINFDTIPGKACVQNQIYICEGSVLGDPQESTIVRYTNNTPVGGETYELNLKHSYTQKDQWLTSIDGDIFASPMLSNLQCLDNDSLLGDFTWHDINISALPIAYLFSTADIPSTDTSDGDLSTESGGYIQYLTESAQDRYLDRFTVDAPDHAVELTSFSPITSGRVFTMSVADFEAASPSAYSLDDNSGVSVLYLTGGGTLNLSNNFTTTAAAKNLLIITDADNILVDSGVFNSGAYSITSPPAIQAPLITTGNVTIDTAGTSDDSPIMFSSPFIVKGTITNDRDLGEDNISYPSVAYKFEPSLLHRLTLMERTENTYLNFTGISTFYTEWDYGF